MITKSLKITTISMIMISLISVFSMVVPGSVLIGVFAPIPFLVAIIIGSTFIKIGPHQCAFGIAVFVMYSAVSLAAVIALVLAGSFNGYQSISAVALILQVYATIRLSQGLGEVCENKNLPKGKEQCKTISKIAFVSTIASVVLIIGFALTGGISPVGIEVAFNLIMLSCYMVLARISSKLDMSKGFCGETQYSRKSAKLY